MKKNNSVLINSFRLILAVGFAATLAGCNPDSSNKGGVTPPPADRVTQQNFEFLTLNDWCAETDSDNDGKIGSFRFSKDGSVIWVGLDVANKNSYGKETLRYSLRQDVLQIGPQIGTSFADRITFSGFGVDRKLTFFDHNINQNNDGQQVVGAPSFIGKVCDLSPYL